MILEGGNILKAIVLIGVLVAGIVFPGVAAAKPDLPHWGAGDGDSIENYPVDGYNSRLDPKTYRTFDQNFEHYKIHSLMPGDPSSN